MKMRYNVLKWAAYTTNLSMSVVACLSPLLFVNFNTLYGISYTKLGLLVLINFVTQLGVDLLLSFFPHKFNIEKNHSANTRTCCNRAFGLCRFSVRF